MRLIEQQMNQAIATQVSWSKDNTKVIYTEGNRISLISLHGHNIAYYDHILGELVPNLGTLAEWPTRTTKSRLRALGVDVYTRKHITYVNGEAV